MSVSDSDDSGSINSMLHVRASVLYPKKVMIETPETASIPLPFSPLSGESVEYRGRVTDGILALSNYRLYFQKSGRDGKGDFNIPLGLVESVELKDMFYVVVACKDCRTYRCSFPSNDVCVDWYRKITKAIMPPKTLDELFTFVYYAWACEEGGTELSPHLSPDLTPYKENFKKEYDRMRFDTEAQTWRITSINSNYQLCPSYPKYFIVPASVSDQTLETAAKFRSSRRVPAVVWRHRENGMIIARCSQPEVGWLGWRSPEDEELLKLLTEACFPNRLRQQSQPSGKLLVMDARSYTSAVANRARGGGCECNEYYPTINIRFMNLPNIHSIRKSFHALRQLCATTADAPNWHSMLDGTKWLSNMSALINAAINVVTALERESTPVLVHCSDGWDRTTQIVSLAELLLDPYYRTVEGFQILCEREWLAFGHKFADRCGIGDDVNEKCPVFLQWLDCVYNVLEQFPCAFEFSKRYLIKLAEHTSSNLFGTFLCNNSYERQKSGIAQRTFSVWRYLSASQFHNYLYNPNHEKVLWPRCNVRDLQVWRDLYIDLAYDNQGPLNDIENNEPAPNGENQNIDKDQTNDIVENGSLNNLGNNLDSMLESAINCQPDVCSSGIVSNGDEISDPGCEVNSCSELNVKVPDVNGLDRSEINDVSAENENIKDCNNSDNIRVINALCDDYTVNLDLKDNINVCNNEKSVYKNIEDCDNLSERNTSKNSEDCCKIVDELEDRLNGDASVETSVETVVENNFRWNNDDIKTAISGLTTYDASLYPTSRPPLTSLLLDPIDGLPLIPDDIQDRMQQIDIEHKAKQAALCSELHTTRYALMNKICHQCVHQNSNPPEKQQIVSDDDKGSVCSTEISWEAVDEKDVRQVLWMPDHAVNFCTGCNNRFWMGRRKHHCRGCGKIFCNDCSKNVIILPNEQLFDPVRVCEECYQVETMSPCLSYSNSPRQTTCKQAAAGEESQNSNLVLPPASSI